MGTGGKALAGGPILECKGTILSFFDIPVGLCPPNLASTDGRSLRGFLNLTSTGVPSLPPDDIVLEEEEEGCGVEIPVLLEARASGWRGGVGDLTALVDDGCSGGLAGLVGDLAGDLLGDLEFSLSATSIGCRVAFFLEDAFFLDVFVGFGPGAAKMGSAAGLGAVGSCGSMTDCTSGVGSVAGASANSGSTASAILDVIVDCSVSLEAEVTVAGTPSGSSATSAELRAFFPFFAGVFFSVFSLVSLDFALVFGFSLAFLVSGWKSSSTPSSISGISKGSDLRFLDFGLEAGPEVEVEMELAGAEDRAETDEI